MFCSLATAELQKPTWQFEEVDIYLDGRQDGPTEYGRRRRDRWEQASANAEDGKDGQAEDDDEDERTQRDGRRTDWDARRMDDDGTNDRTDGLRTEDDDGMDYGMDKQRTTTATTDTTGRTDDTYSSKVKNSTLGE